jgi:hypothetical protein
MENALLGREEGVCSQHGDEDPVEDPQAALDDIDALFVMGSNDPA